MKICMAKVGGISMVSPEFKKCGYVLIIASFLSHDKFLRIADIAYFILIRWELFNH